MSLATVHRYFEVVNADRFEELRAIFAPDVVLDMAGSQLRRGVDEAIAYYPRALAALPVHHDDPVTIVGDQHERRVMVEIVFTGRTTDDRPVEFTAVDLFDLDESGRITRVRSIYDTEPVRQQVQPPD
jgi:ketosteroid isomerase-like protein